ncbi:MAG: Excinuclease ATPase subunit [Hyphomicrobiales bacterium]|nr:Excinuclease ATPase subunit [Hyphomicrobiales bacterium]
MATRADSTADRGAGSAQLRGKIDAGVTGDKVAFPDPAASPLGTDDEAGGAPMRRDAVADAALQAAAARTPNTAPDQTGPWVWAIVVAGLLVIAAATAVLYWPAV